MFVTRRTLAVTLCLGIAACGGQRAHEGFDGGTSAYALSLVGGANLTLHPGDKRTLQVIFTRDQVGPVAGAALHFEFQDGDPGGATVDAAEVQTDKNGIATIHFVAGTTAVGGRTFKVVASAPTYGPDPVAFSFNVIPVRRMLQIVRTATTTPASDLTSARTILGVSTSAGLKVREMDADTGAPIAGDTITFTLAPAAIAHWSGSAGRSASAQTGAGGEAQAYLLTTTQPEATQAVAAPQGGGSGVTFNVTVQSGGGASCATNAQCAPGEVCAGNPPTCQPGGSGTGCNNGSDNACPYGYICVNNVCQPPAGGNCDPKAPSCPNTQCCNPSSNTCADICPGGCGAGLHCQPGATCGAGTCVSDSTVPDATGVWLTKHDYSIKQALPAAVQDIFYGIRVLDQALLGKLTIPGLPGWLQKIINSFISQVLQQYLPDWLKQVIHISDDIVTILSSLRSEGSMHLARSPDVAHLRGSEVWTSLVFYWLPLCNGNIGGDPGVPPDCARIDIATTDSQNPGEVGQCKGQSLPSITVQVAPFTATVTGTGASSAPPYAINVDQRQVKLKMGKVLLVLVDTLLSFVTPYHCIDEITDCTPGPGNCPLVDCYGLGQDVSNSTGGFLDPGLIESLCDGVVTEAGQLVTQALANAWDPTLDTLDFRGRATVSGTADVSSCDDGATSTCAARLGNDNWDRDLNGSNVGNRDGSWTGAFFLKTIGNLPGAWEAKRPQ